MNKSLSPRQQQAIEAESLRDTRPFLWFLTAVLFFLYVIALNASPALREPARLIPVYDPDDHPCGAALAAAALCGKPPPVRALPCGADRDHRCPFLAERNPAIVAGLYLALAGETVGVLEDWRQSLLVLRGDACLDGADVGHHLGLAFHRAGMAWGQLVHGPVCDDVCADVHAPDECPRRGAAPVGRTGAGAPPIGRVRPGSGAV